MNNSRNSVIYSWNACQKKNNKTCKHTNVTQKRVSKRILSTPLHHAEITSAFAFAFAFSFFFFFFFFLTKRVFYGWNWYFSGSCTLFTRPTFFNKTFITNRSHGTIHIFENYFAIVFSVFSKIGNIQTDPKSTNTP